MSENWYYNFQYSHPPPPVPNANYQYQPPPNYNLWPTQQQTEHQIFPLPNLSEPPPDFTQPPPSIGNYIAKNDSQNASSYFNGTYSPNYYVSYPCVQSNPIVNNFDAKPIEPLGLNTSQPLYNFKEELESYKNKKNELNRKNRVTRSETVSASSSSSRSERSNSKSQKRYQRSRSRSRGSRSQSKQSSRHSHSSKHSESRSFRSRSYRSRSRSRSHSRKRKDNDHFYDRDKTSRNNSPQSKTPTNPSKITERDRILQKWKKNYCATGEEVCNKIKELSKETQEDILEKEKQIWTRTTPADLYYVRDENNPKIIRATPKLIEICNVFEEKLVQRARKINEKKPKYEPPPRKHRTRICKHKSEQHSSSGSSDEDFSDEEDCSMEELTRKQQHPDRLHPEMWNHENFNFDREHIPELEKHSNNRLSVTEQDEYLFREILELVDLNLKAAGDSSGCSQFHFMPRFVRELPDNGKEILSMKEVLQYLLDSSIPLIEESELPTMVKMSQYEWQSYADEIKGMVVTYPGKKPCSVRVDQLDRNLDFQEHSHYKFPEIVHFGIRPPQLSYAGNPEYQKAWRDYVKFRHLLANMSKPTFEDKRKLEAKENKLQEMRTQSKMKRDVTVAVSAKGFFRTGIMCDIVQHAMLIPVLVCHLRFHNSLSVLEETINYKFNNRGLLQLALTHPSYRENFGTNPDHSRNTLTNCGIRQPEYGDRRIHYMNTRKRGINTLINIMSRFGKKQETESNITHNERLEFLGDAVVEFLSSIHLFYTFPDLEEGGLATYRAAIVQNQHLAVLARTLNLDHYMLYAHGSDLCHDLELRHAMANCFEALMGALFLDGGIEVADRVFSETLFKDRPDLYEVWQNLPPHPLQEQEPQGDREWIPKFKLLQKLTEFEDSIGVQFMHIRLLARGFTDRSVGYTNLTLGSNQRLEFLGDTVLQLIASEYLYKYFPEHHEGHLSLLRSSLVNNRTQAVVCDDLGMANYAVYNNPKAELKTKDRADLLEAFIGALYVDKGLEYCQVFCQVTLFPRLQDFIMNQDWNDPKSKLQQCCLTLRTMDGGEPDIPVYKVIECKGPTNTRVYTVAVYFRGKRLASAMGHSIQQAEMNAAKKALEISKDLFPQLDHQKRVIAKSMKKQKYPHKWRQSISRSHTRSPSSSAKQSRKSTSRHSRRSCSQSHSHRSSSVNGRSHSSCSKIHIHKSPVKSYKLNTSASRSRCKQRRSRKIVCRSHSRNSLHKICSKSNSGDRSQRSCSGNVSPTSHHNRKSRFGKCMHRNCAVMRSHSKHHNWRNRSRESKRRSCPRSSFSQDRTQSRSVKSSGKRSRRSRFRERSRSSHSRRHIQRSYSMDHNRRSSRDRSYSRSRSCFSSSCSKDTESRSSSTDSNTSDDERSPEQRASKSPPLMMQNNKGAEQDREEGEIEEE